MNMFLPICSVLFQARSRNVNIVTGIDRAPLTGGALFLSLRANRPKCRCQSHKLDSLVQLQGSATNHTKEQNNGVHGRWLTADQQPLQPAARVLLHTKTSTTARPPDRLDSTSGARAPLLAPSKETNLTACSWSKEGNFPCTTR